MTNLPGYDAYKLASPPYLDGYPPCANCGHDQERHVAGHDNSELGDQLPFCAEPNCYCDEYTDEPLEPDPDRAHDEARET